MATTAVASLSVSELARLLKEAEPAAYLVPPRVLRRVIKQHRQLGGVSLLVPHRKTYVIDAGPLLELVDRDELGLAAGEGLPAKVILLAQPDQERLDRLGREPVGGGRR